MTSKDDVTMTAQDCVDDVLKKAVVMTYSR
jgi:hypothetical protein